MTTETKTIDMTPTWAALLPVLVHVANNGDTSEGRKAAMGELMRLAVTVDRLNATKTYRKAVVDGLVDACRDAIALINDPNAEEREAFRVESRLEAAIKTATGE